MESMLQYKRLPLAEENCSGILPNYKTVHLNNNSPAAAGIAQCLHWLIDWVGFSFPLNTLYVILGTDFFRVKWSNQQCQSTEGSSSPKHRLQSHQVHLTMLQYYTCMQCTQNNTYTKPNLCTVKWAQWDKTQSRELLGLFICVCIALCTIVAHNIAQNRPDNFPSYPPDNHHCSDDVYLREVGTTVSTNLTTQICVINSQLQLILYAVSPLAKNTRKTN